LEKSRSKALYTFVPMFLDALQTRFVSMLPFYQYQTHLNSCCLVHWKIQFLFFTNLGRQGGGAREVEEGYRQNQQLTKSY
jgi:hypothetical protein